MLLFEDTTHDEELVNVASRGATLTKDDLPRAARTPTPRPHRINRTGLAWLTGCLLLGASLLAIGRDPASRIENTKPIEQVRVGERALVDAPAAALAADNNNNNSGELSLAPIVPSQWRLIRMQAFDNSTAGVTDDINIETLQPLEWISRHQIRVGSDAPIPLDLVEMGLPERLTATVLAIERCPPIEPGPGRVVLTTINHLNNVVMELTLEDDLGRQETLRPTAPHKFYSVTADAWVSASELKTGDVLDGVEGPVTVKKATRVPGIHRVYNMTVQGEHLYRVAQSGVLVHNMDCGDAGPRPGGLGYPGSMQNAPRVELAGASKLAADQRYIYRVLDSSDDIDVGLFAKSNASKYGNFWDDLAYHVRYGSNPGVKTPVISATTDLSVAENIARQSIRKHGGFRTIVQIDLKATNARIVDLRNGGLATHSTRAFAKVADNYATGWKEIAILNSIYPDAIKFLKKVE